MSDNNIILSAENLGVSFYTEDGISRAVQDVSFSMERGKTFALVGESGCGKSVTALSIMGLVPSPPGEIVSGNIYFNNKDLLKLSPRRMRTIRGNKIAMIFQEPMTSLNPVYTIGDQIAEAITLHQHKTDEQAWAQAVDVLKLVGMSDPEKRVYEYPHQLSGGMRQRVMIAMAISCKPELLIADEPTTALDVTVQAQILNLLDELQGSGDMSMLLITHDLGIVAERAHRVAVMYASKIVEVGRCRDIFDAPLHPYTRGLLKSLPRLGVNQNRLETIPGAVPEPLNFPAGCKFHPRCPLGHNDARCQSSEPDLREVKAGRFVACWYVEGYETEKERLEYESKFGKTKRISAGS